MPADAERLEQFKQVLDRLPEDYNFDMWLTTTRRLQELAYDAFYDQMDDETRADSMMMNLYAATSEIVEMGDEMGWKPWAPPRGWINREAAIREAVDIMHFLGNLLTHCQATGEELTAAYKAKQLKNLQRQIDNYDGKSDKCGYCRRDLTEIPWPARLQIFQEEEINAILKFCNKDHADKYKEQKH